ncbi:UDP-N-acetylmuramoyl-L-alanine--D-glutamate ligase [Actinomycetaceae bacterium TAE3-ERU4]|nr:UDP-N-acetylmuramoyl-L-alanine--D-glutamate ligase [Actinomycetaceae bacterium TAE3-ERU4]
MKAIVIGAGKTGLNAALVLLDKGYEVLVCETNPTAAKTAQEAGLEVLQFSSAEELGLEVSRQEADFVLASPGISPFSPALSPVTKVHEVISEPELAWRLQAENGGAQPWLCVTGTNGKTTTVGMTEAILRAAGKKTKAVGNNGVSLINEVAAGDYDVLVVELSSFQLHFTSSLRPLASVCLNLETDHLDWHGSEAEYRRCKARVYENTQVACIYPKSDPKVVEMVEQADVQEGARAIGVTLGHPGPSDFGLVENLLVDRAFVTNRYKQAAQIAELEDLEHISASSPSPALVMDALTAAALSRAAGVGVEAVSQGLREFIPAGHRRALVGKVADVTWIDDSKATNAHAAKASLQGIEPGRTVWIVGGFSKGQNLSALISEVASRLRGAIVIGEDRREILESFAKYAPQLPVVEVDGHEDFMMSVVHEAVALSRPGDTVLLAPACASWDQFTSYAQRGDAFCNAVERLAEQQ